MEQVRQGLKGGRQLPLQHSLISEMRAQGAKETREIWSAAPKSLVLNGLSPGIT